MNFYRVRLYVKPSQGCAKVIFEDVVAPDREAAAAWCIAAAEQLGLNLVSSPFVENTNLVGDGHRDWSRFSPNGTHKPE